MSEREVPRYMQIVAELRQRIAMGELSPGERVPPTREIMQLWGVAMATATKVLTELRRQGLVRVVPGVGTIVDVRQVGPEVLPSTRQAPAPSIRRAPTPDHALTLDRIVAAAIAVADEEGLAATSMRRVATELGVATMSLYRHVPGKERLLMHMMCAVLAEARFPADPPASWRVRLEIAARLLWDLFRRHPWLAAALSRIRPQPLAASLPYTEWVLATLEENGVDLPTAFTVDLTLFNYVRGVAVNLTESDPVELCDTANGGWAGQHDHFLAGLARGGFPATQRFARIDYDFDLDELFEFGLQRLLDGFSPLICDEPPCHRTG
ncbi:GntR family transcriptional regulator [Sinosporangium siamense]|uniref:GntR family transcriptional regulator n=1 Tax=Sinosporangium siamense TaxID=1367973 RepID=A0A919V9K8_9ACTN|nr:GntR family transcriptional regulator [Sinosporangium siamense]GII94412.1 GntR family transcriptional regulator [Sinosporangium siamense]